MITIKVENLMAVFTLFLMNTMNVIKMKTTNVIINILEYVSMPKTLILRVIQLTFLLFSIQIKSTNKQAIAINTCKLK